MLTVASPPSGRVAAATAAAAETCLVLDVDRAQELLSLCAQEGHPLIFSGHWVQQQCGVNTLQGLLSGCDWGQGQLTLHVGGASLSWHERQVTRTEWRRWREPLGLRHGLRLLDLNHDVALHIGAPLRSPQCEGALWRTWMDWIADLPVSSARNHTA
ncbi:MAG: hypothetical protein U5L74_03175 [Ideonella sp.]|nr:hypothetical protein [Ideonella sp.]